MKRAERKSSTSTLKPDADNAVVGRHNRLFSEIPAKGNLRFLLRRKYRFDISGLPRKEGAMVKINGIETEAQGMTLTEYLQTTSYNPGRIAVERNGDIIPKAKYEETVLCDGDAIEIVSFVGGG